MALLRIDHSSVCVKVNLPLYIILPSPASLKDKSLADFRVLYLLHGLSDDASAWQRYTNIEILAREQDLAVVMPTGGRSMYTDMNNGQAYFSYLTEELPEYLRKLYRLNLTRENTAIAGLSMGGYGAFKVALSYPEDYAIAGSFSGALDVRSLSRGEEGWEAEYRGIFGDPVTFLPENDLFHLLESAYEKGSRLPFLYQTCGTEDFLLENNRAFRRKLEANPKIETLYLESRGDHEWDYWDRQLNAFMKAFQRLISKE